MKELIKDIITGLFKEQTIPAVVEEKIITAMEGTVKKLKNTDTFLEQDSNSVCLKFIDNTFLKKLEWDKKELFNKYGHLIYSQNIRAINTQFKKLLIKEYQFVEEKIERLNATNVAVFLKDLLSIIRAIGHEETLIDVKYEIDIFAKKFKLNID